MEPEEDSELPLPGTPLKDTSSTWVESSIRGKTSQGPPRRKAEEKRPGHVHLTMGLYSPETPAHPQTSPFLFFTQR